MAKACKGKEHRATVVDTRKRLTKPPPGSALSPPEQNCSQPEKNANMLRIPSSRHNFVSGGVEIQQSTGDSEYQHDDLVDFERKLFGHMTERKRTISFVLKDDICTPQHQATDQQTMR